MKEFILFTSLLHICSSKIQYRTYIYAEVVNTVTTPTINATTPNNIIKNGT